ncbi:MAG: PKD domain-containing protein, partial [Chloroflexi bacterium]|nr:PKD domain-containing protein [Chloroflexota bacterium]
PEDGVYNVLVTVSDNDGASGSASATVTVNNMAPVVEAGPDAEIVVGSSHSLAPATFSNAGANDSHVSVINWGDGILMDGLVTESTGSGSIAGSHAYASAGSYTVTVTATDDDGGSGQDTFIVTVIAEQSEPSEPAGGTDELDTRYMTGGGNRSVGNGEDAQRYSWGFKIRCDGSKGSFQFNDHATSSKFHLESIESVTCWSQPGVHEGTLFDSLSLVGSGRWNGEPGARIEATMISAGESDGSDRLELLIWNASGTPAETVPSALSGGNHKAHQGVDGEEDATEPVLLLDAPSEPKIKVTREAPSEHAAHAAVNHIRTSLMRIIAALLAWWQNFFAAGFNSQPDARPATLGHAPSAGLDSTAWAWSHSGSPDLKRSARNTR